MQATQPNPGTDGIFGSGTHRYQFTLVDPFSRVAVDTQFALSLHGNRDLPFVHDQKDVWRGVTDGRGQTPVFALPFSIKLADVFLRGRLGDGPYGEQFQVRDSDNSLVPLYPYRLIICTNPPEYMVGLTDAGGNTFYGASQRRVPILLVAADLDLAKRGTASLSFEQRALFEADNNQRCAEKSSNDKNEGGN